MNVLFIVLNQSELIDEILDSFIEIGVKGATIFDSQGMGSIMSRSAKSQDPFYGVISGFLANTRPFNKTIFTVIEDQEVLENAIKAVQAIVGDMNKPGAGLMFTVPVGRAFGL